MAIKLKVDFDLAPFKREVSKFVKKQIPFAASLAVNRVAEIAKQDLRKSLRKDFVIRTKWVEKGIQRTRATKRKPESTVGSRDEFMALHVTGGTKRKGAVDGGRSRKEGPGPGRSMGVPASPGPARKSKTGRTLPSKWPDKFGQRGKRKPFIIKIRGKVALARRKGKKRFPLQMIYFFKKSVKIDKRWDFLKIVELSLTRNWASEAVRALEDALKSAK